MSRFDLRVEAPFRPADVQAFLSDLAPLFDGAQVPTPVGTFDDTNPVGEAESTAGDTTLRTVVEIGKAHGPPGDVPYRQHHRLVAPRASIDVHLNQLTLDARSIELRIETEDLDAIEGVRAVIVERFGADAEGCRRGYAAASLARRYAAAGRDDLVEAHLRRAHAVTYHDLGGPDSQVLLDVAADAGVVLRDPPEAPPLPSATAEQIERELSAGWRGRFFRRVDGELGTSELGWLAAAVVKGQFFDLLPVVIDRHRGRGAALGAAVVPAVYKQRVDVLRSLVEAGAFVDPADPDVAAAIDWARRIDALDAVALLERAGAVRPRPRPIDAGPPLAPVDGLPGPGWSTTAVDRDAAARLRQLVDDEADDAELDPDIAALTPAELLESLWPAVDAGLGTLERNLALFGFDLGLVRARLDKVAAANVGYRRNATPVRLDDQAADWLGPVLAELREDRRTIATWSHRALPNAADVFEREWCRFAVRLDPLADEATTPAARHELRAVLLRDLPHGAPDLAAVHDLRRCRVLALESCGITSDEIADTMHLDVLTELRALDLSHNDIGSGLPMRFDGLTNLEWLRLRGNERLQELPDELLALPRLRYLDLRETGLAGAADELARALPGCEVVA